MAEGKSIPVRLPESVIKRLDAVSEKSGLRNRSAVMKFCITTFIDHFERTGESSLPPNWREILHNLDQRSHRYDSTLQIAAEKHEEYGTKNSGKGKQPSKQSQGD
jgi:hypothetical protein